MFNISQHKRKMLETSIFSFFKMPLTVPCFISTSTFVTKNYITDIVFLTFYKPFHNFILLTILLICFSKSRISISSKSISFAITIDSETLFLT